MTAPTTMKAKGADNAFGDVPIYAPGRQPAAHSKPMALADEDFAAIGAKNEGAPADDTAAAGLNGRLQRIAQRLTSLLTRLQDPLAVSTPSLVMRSAPAGGPTPMGKVPGTGGAVGDYLDHVIIIPTSLSPGAVKVVDDTGVTRTIFPGGPNSVQTLHPFDVPFGVVSEAGAFKLDCGANVSAIGVGKFS